MLLQNHLPPPGVPSVEAVHLQLRRVRAREFTFPPIRGAY